MNTRGRSLVGPCVAWLLSFAPFLIHESTLAGVSRTALAALPWIAYAGLPRTSDGGRVRAWGDLALEMGLLLPPIALGAWVDLAIGIARVDVVTIALSSLVLCASLALAARCASRSPRGVRLHALLWLLLVALWPLLQGALVLGGAPLFGRVPHWMSFASRASPIDWAVASLRSDDTLRSWPWAPFAVALALVAVGFAAGRADTERGDSERADSERANTVEPRA